MTPEPALHRRCERDYNRKHVMMSRWRGGQDPEADLSGFTTIVLYDDDSTGWEDASEKMAATYDRLKAKNLTPVCVSGGFQLLENKFPYMWSSKVMVIYVLSSNRMTPNGKVFGNEVYFFPLWEIVKTSSMHYVFVSHVIQTTTMNLQLIL